MISYTDSEVRTFHPLCEKALTQAIAALGLSSIYEAKHHVYTGSLEMDYVVINKTTGKYLGYISKMVNSRNRINEKIIFLHVSNTEEICDLMHSFLD